MSCSLERQKPLFQREKTQRFACPCGSILDGESLWNTTRQISVSKVRRILGLVFVVVDVVVVDSSEGWTEMIPV